MGLVPSYIDCQYTALIRPHALPSALSLTVPCRDQGKASDK